MGSGKRVWWALGAVWLVGLAAMVLSRDRTKSMTRESPPSNFDLASPGVIATDDTEVPGGREIYGFFPGGVTGLRTVEYVAYGYERHKMEAMHSVEWYTSVPAGAKLFSVTAGISPAKVREFWVGWISGGQIQLRSLSKLRTLTSSLSEGETAIFPAIMDASGNASLYTWRVAEKSATLWKRVFSSTGVSPPRFLLEIQGRPTAYGAAAVPGLRSPNAVVGWVAKTEEVASVLGVAVVENERVTVHGSSPVPGSAPIARQRLGLWAHAIDQIELAAVLAGNGPPNYTLAKFRVTAERADGHVETEVLELKPGQLASAAVDYVSGSPEPVGSVVLLAIDGQLFDMFGRSIRQSVSLDSVLPVVRSRRGPFWGKIGSDGTLVFEPL
jgi:hypothetical protein